MTVVEGTWSIEEEMALSVCRLSSDASEIVAQEDKASNKRDKYQRRGRGC